MTFFYYCLRKRRTTDVTNVMLMVASAVALRRVYCPSRRTHYATTGGYYRRPDGLQLRRLPLADTLPSPACGATPAPPALTLPRYG